VPVAVDLVKAHVTMSVVLLPAVMNESPQDSEFPSQYCTVKATWYYKSGVPQDHDWKHG
jgi:hypothetical protein